MQHDNIKFVRYNHSSSAKIPLETMSAGQNRVYVLVNDKDVLKSISFYGKDGIMNRRIDLEHAQHHGYSPHVHDGSFHSAARKPTIGENALVQKVRSLWNQR